MAKAQYKSGRMRASRRADDRVTSEWRRSMGDQSSARARAASGHARCRELLRKTAVTAAVLCVLALCVTNWRTP